MKLIDKTTESGKVVKLNDYKKRVRRNRLKRKILLFIFILIILFTILLYAPFMKIKTINCTGNEKISAEEIISSSNICFGNNIFRINKGKAEDNIENISYIKNVSIDRRLPNSININVEECQVRAYIINNKDYIYIDETGKILEIANTPPKNQAAIVEGIKLKNIKINEICEFKNKLQLGCLTSILSTTVNSRFNGLITNIDLTDLKKIKFVVNGNLDIIIGETDNLDYKINFMASGAYDSLGANRGGILDVSYGSSAVFKEKNDF